MSQLAAGLLLAAAVLTDPAVAQEDTGIDVVVGLSLASTTLSFDEKLDADPNFPAYAVFGSVARGRGFATLSWADSFGSTSISEEDEIGRAERDDLDLTLGYRFGNAWTGFIGYRDGETSIDFQVRDSDIVQQEFYREQGVYIGGSYSLSFANSGTLSFNAAYIDFDADLGFTAGIDDDDDGEEEEVEFDDLEGTFSGPSEGFSLGISWVMPLGENLAFRSLYKLNDYQLTVESDEGTFKPDQQLRYLEIGLLYAF